MHEYNGLERSIGKLLDSNPIIRDYLKAIYQSINYFAFSWKNTKKALLNNGVVSIELDSEMGSFFGYYDKSPWSPDGNNIAFHAITKDPNVLDISIYSINSRITRVVASCDRAWTWQQGAMLTWLNNRRILFNDFEGDKLVCRELDIISGYVRDYTHPLQCLSSDGEYYVSINYLRLADIGSEYGIKQKGNVKGSLLPENEDGMWRVELGSGKVRLILTLQDLMEYRPTNSMPDAFHKINHVMASPNGKRLLFMHRWINTNGKYSRLYTIDSNGKNLFLLADERMISHYSWRGNGHILAWARKNEHGDRYYLFKDQCREFSIIGRNILDQHGDGHPSCSPNGKWIVTDTYPSRDRYQSLLMYNLDEKRLITVGRFLSPWKFRHVVERCDLHPRFSRDCKWLAIDSTHNGRRQLCLINVASLVGDD